MAIILNEPFNEDGILGMWEITEDFDYLRSMVTLDEKDVERLESFKNHQRKLEWLSVRVLLNSLTDKDSRIVYGPERKPYLHNNSHNISISHSKELTAILLNKKRRVGLDLEFMSDKVLRIAEKFMRPEELESIDKNQEIYHLYLHWCAKEALYKICDKVDINFVTNLKIEPFKPKDKGLIIGVVNNSYMNEKFTLNYFTHKNYAVVWCYK
ncbi:MAG: 4'-phosphopantetheinyl transferase superfamily protein [Bacteroidales bacterium]|jgi:phosphopantetheinyl transferase (holo-ACP synthase)|nr:4'-phosphopantetheinyl transferase superfamily protein [Bacteroidales bacterium]